MSKGERVAKARIAAHGPEGLGEVKEVARAGLSPAGAKIVAAFEEAVEGMRAGGTAGRRITVRTYELDFAPHAYGPDGVRRVRDLLGMSQVVFARFLGVDANTVQSWEQGVRSPSPIARRFLEEIEADPGHWRRRIAQSVKRVDKAGPSA